MSQSTTVVAQHELRGMVSISKVKTCHQSLQVSKAIHVWPIPLVTLHKFLPMKFEDENFVVAKLITEIINITFLNPLRTVVAYMRQGDKYFTVLEQIFITSLAFTL